MTIDEFNTKEAREIEKLLEEKYPHEKVSKGCQWQWKWQVSAFYNETNKHTYISLYEQQDFGDMMLVSNFTANVQRTPSEVFNKYDIKKDRCDILFLCYTAIQERNKRDFEIRKKWMA